MASRPASTPPASDPPRPAADQAADHGTDDGTDDGTDQRADDRMRPWDLPWAVRLGIPALVGFVLQVLVMMSGGRSWDRALVGGAAMAVFIAGWLRWRLPKMDARKQAEEREVGRGGWSNPTPMQRVADRWFSGRRRRSDRNPLSGNAPRQRR